MLYDTTMLQGIRPLELGHGMTVVRSVTLSVVRHTASQIAMCHSLWHIAMVEASS